MKSVVMNWSEKIGPKSTTATDVSTRRTMTFAPTSPLCWRSGSSCFVSNAWVVLLRVFQVKSSVPTWRIQSSSTKRSRLMNGSPGGIGERTRWPTVNGPSAAAEAMSRTFRIVRGRIFTFGVVTEFGSAPSR